VLWKGWPDQLLAGILATAGMFACKKAGLLISWICLTAHMLVLSSRRFIYNAVVFWIYFCLSLIADIFQTICMHLWLTHGQYILKDLITFLN
jgi:hypothetical protein